MARRRAFIFAPIILAIGIGLVIALVTLFLNIFLYTFADDVADMITKMPRMYQYSYMAPVVLLCDFPKESKDTCRTVCESRNVIEGPPESQWKFVPSGDRMLCEGPTDLSVATGQIDSINRQIGQKRAGHENPTSTVLGSVGLIQSVFVYPSRAAEDPIKATIDEYATKQEDRPSRVPFYYMMVGIGLAILLINTLIAIVYWLFEDTPLMKLEQSMTMFRGIITVGIIMLIIPIVWDPLVIFIENSAMFIMSPGGKYAGDVAAQVVLEAGAVRWPDFNMEQILSNIIFHPGGVWGGIGDVINGAVQETFVQVIMGFARAQATVMTLVTMYITSIIRVEITMVAVMMYPIAAALSLNPLFKGNELFGAVKAHIIGGLIAPITGAIIFVTGYATIEAQYATGALALERWITALTILIIASTVPVATMKWVGAAAADAKAIIGDSISTAMKVGAPMLGAAGALFAGGAGGGGGGGGIVGAAGSIIAGSTAGAVGSAVGGSGGGRGGGGGSISADEGLMGGNQTQGQSGKKGQGKSGDDSGSEDDGDGETAEKPSSKWDNLKSGLFGGMGAGAGMLPGMMGGKHGLMGNEMTKGSQKQIEGVAKDFKTNYGERIEENKARAKETVDKIKDAENAVEDTNGPSGDPQPKFFGDGYDG